ncbi:1-phosphofructokinase [Pseudoxanthomonas sp. JBR18]|uniref:1-phosphofructokinase n=1 Tax=Pseudoxanthomonas sp. JBR18 TaxID=2969308 RepID=UPI0023051EB2|nr:1-phosphofructokinase [Pseudoxanthomonas sp. JBR18]WCE03630.1 1-phosphofructokinase [Pseudoxanthomonas sp. JBR18]
MSARVLTVTLNPAIDQTVRLTTLEPGHVHRAGRSREDAGGKGINVAACLADWGVPTTALGVIGVDNEAVFRGLFELRGIADACLRVPGQTRTNVKLVERDGRTTDINLPGLCLDEGVLDAVAQRLATLLRPQMPVVLSGSLPAGLPPTAWALLLAQVQAAGARVLLDSSGPALVAALEGDTVPFAVKPNRHELEAWTGRTLADRDAVLDAGRALLARGVSLVAVSMGSDGALFLDRSGALLARPPRLADGSTVGAGDAMVAGIAAALLEPSFDLAGCARLATAFSMSRLHSGDARRLDPAQVRAWAGEVQIERVA